MATDNDTSRSKRASHLSSATPDSSSGAARTRRTATKRAAAPARATSRRSATNRTAVGATGATAPKPATHMSERTARATQRAAAAHKRRAQGSHPSSKSKNHVFPVAAFVALVAVAAVVAVGFLVVPHLFQREEVVEESYPAGELVIVTVPDGAGGSQIAQLLKENHVIFDEQLFYQEIQKQNADASMKSGTYQFVTGATPSEVVKQLVSGPNATEYQLKLAEGLTVTQTAAQVESQLGISADDFIAQAKASNYVDEFPFLADVSDDSLEGYLFAKTYDFGGTDMSADTVIRTMLKQYQTEVASLDFDAARDLIASRYSINISDYAFIKLASVVEKEATTDEDRPLIASVFYNRMGRDFPGLGYIRPYLESDATMMYVTGGEVTADDLQSDSAYNSYLNPNLPPTPICSPSLQSIQAALDPAETDYFYFFINDKVHQFSETYDEHQQAISQSLAN